MKIQEIRQKYPQYEDLSDQQIADNLHSKFYADMDRSAFNTSIGLAATNDESDGRGVGGWAQDIGLSLLSGTTWVPQAVVGLADLITNPIRAGVESLTGQEQQTFTQSLANMGMDFKRAQEAATSLKTDQSKQARENVGKAFEEGGLYEGMKSLGSNPSVALEAAAESIPSMLGTAGLTRLIALRIYAQAAKGAATAEAAKLAGESAVKAAMPRLATYAATIEGAQVAGQSAAQFATEGTLSDSETVGSIGTGLTTAAIGRVANKVGAKIGFDDVETTLGAGLGSPDNLLKRVGKGVIREGLLEEAPQSASETAWQNYAEGRPITEGAGRAAAEGAVVGALMGGGANALMRRRDESPDEVINRIVEADTVEDAVTEMDSVVQYGLRTVEPGESLPVEPAGFDRGMEQAKLEDEVTAILKRRDEARAVGDLQAWRQAMVELNAARGSLEQFRGIDFQDTIPTLTDIVPGQAERIQPAPAGTGIPGIDFQTREQAAEAQRRTVEFAPLALTTSRLEPAQQSAPGAQIPSVDMQPASRLTLAPDDVLTPALEGAPAVVPAPITLLNSSGEPFRTKKSASLSRTFRDNPGAEIVPVEGGFGVRPVARDLSLVPKEGDQQPLSAIEANKSNVDFPESNVADVAAPIEQPTMANGPDPVRDIKTDREFQQAFARSKAATAKSIKELRDTLKAEFGEESAKALEIDVKHAWNLRLQRKRSAIGIDDTLVQAVAKLGGIDTSYRQDMTGDTKAGKGETIPGVGSLFSKTGTSPDDMVTKLWEQGYITQSEIDNAKDNGGVNRLYEMVREELSGRRKHYQASSTKAMDAELAKRDEALQSQADQAEYERERTYEDIAAQYGQDAADQARQYDEDMRTYNATLDSILDTEIESRLVQEKDDANEQIKQSAAETDATQGSEPDGQDTGETGRSEGSQDQESAAPEGFELKPQTEAELREQARKQEESRKADEAATARAEIGSNPPELTLAGSDRAVDQAEARGQNNLFDAPAQQSATTELTTAVKELTQAMKAQAEPKAESRQVDNKPTIRQERIEDAGSQLVWNKKGLFKSGGLSWNDIESENDTLKLKMATKGKVWAKPDWEQIVGAIPEGPQKEKFKIMAFAAKSIYDGIPSKPEGKTDASIQAYISALTEAKAATEDFLNNKAGQDDVFDYITAQAARRSRGTYSLSDMMGKTRQPSPVFDALFPEQAAGARFMRGTSANEKALQLGSKALKAMRPNVEMAVKAMQAMEQGWPGKREMWQARGFKVLAKVDITPEFKASSYSDGSKVWRVRMTAPGIAYIPSLDDTATEQDARQAFESLPAYIALNKKNRIVGMADSQEDAEQFLRDLTKNTRDTEDGSEDGDDTPWTRIGVSRRTAGEIISSEILMQAFGFKGVNFGNWVSQAERADFLNAAYDALHDMAEAMNLPPRAVGLNGLLGIAFGAQGSGGALAHFVPGVNEINLTRKKGAGSLAHEWGHALDHYFGVKAGMSRMAEPFASWAGAYPRRNDTGVIRPEVEQAFRAIAETMQSRAETQAEADARRKSMLERSQAMLSDYIGKRPALAGIESNAAAAEAMSQIKAGNVGEYVNLPAPKGKRKSPGAVGKNVKIVADAAGMDTADMMQFNSVATGLKYSMDHDKAESSLRSIHSAFYRASKDKDGDSIGKSYWSTRHEMFARSFEVWVMDKLAANNAKNDFLVRASKGDAGDEAASTSLWPAGADRERINGAFDLLVSAIETEETDNGVALFSRSESTRQAYETRIDELFDGAKASGPESGVRILDRSDILDMLGVDSGSVTIAESKVIAGRDSRPRMTASVWKMIPEWLDNPAAVFESETDGGLVFIAPETVDGKPVRIIVKPVMTGGAEVYIVANAYDAAPQTPYGRWFDDGLARFVDTKKFPDVLEQSGRQLPSTAWKNKPGNSRRILTEKNLGGYRAARKTEVLASRGESQPQHLPRAKTQTHAKILNRTLARYFVSEEWENAYEAVDVPDALSEYGQEVKTAFGRNVQFVAPTDERFGIFNGVYLPRDPTSIYLNAQAEVNITAVAGHELLHVLRKDRPDLYDWFKDQAQDHLQDFDEYQAALNRTIQAGESLYTSSQAQEELLADFAGDALADPSFLQKLADASPAKFKGLLDVVVRLLNKAILRLRGLKSSKHIGDVEALRDKLQQALVAYANGEPISSDNNGDFDPQNPSILFSRENQKIDSSLAKIADRVLATPGSTTMVGRARQAIDDIRDRWQLKFRQGAVDQFASVADLEIQQYGALRDASDSAYKAAAFSKNSGTVLDAAMNMGALQYKDGGIEIVEGSKGLIQIFEPLAKIGLVREWELWAGAVRANRLLAEGKERNYTQADVDAILSAVAGNKLKLYQKIQREWTQYNKHMLDFAQSAGLINAEQRQLWERDDYVPFHRVSELSEGGQTGPARRGGLSGQTSGVRQLKGGVEKISILESMVRNTAHMIDASMKNVAMQRIIGLAEQAEIVESVRDARITDDEAKRRLDEAGIDYTDSTLGAWKGLIEKYDAREGTVTVSNDGKTTRYIVHDPMLLRAMTGLGPTGIEGIMKVLRLPKRLLTEMVTADPSFALRNLIRDTLSTWVTVHDIKRNPISDAVKNVVAAYKENPTLRQMRAQGVGGGGFYDTSPEGARAHLERVSGKAGIGTTIAEMWQAYKRVLGTTEVANRMAVYDATIKAGGTKAEAAYQAQDVLNFSRHGEWKAVRMLIEVVPFMNSRFQGLDRMYRGAVEGKPGERRWSKAFLLKGAILTAATLALLAANWDNEEYWDLEEWERDTYYHIFVGGEHFRLPKPFEVGAVFSTIPERLFEQFRADADLKLLGKRMLAMIADTFAMDPTPQIFKPMLEVAMNRSSFTGRDILTQGMQYASPEAQYNPYTSKTFIELADAMPDSAPAWMRSPARLEHLYRGYMGTLGGYVMMGSDAAVRQIADSPAKPALRAQDVPVVGSFFRDGEGSNKQVGQVYDMARDVNEIYAAIRKYQQEGRIEKAQQLMNDERQKLQARRGLNQITNAMGDISSQIKKIYDHPAMTPQQKRERIDELTLRRNEAAKRFAEMYRDYF